MQKLTELVEKYVEWVALAIGGAFLAAMVFMYLISSPVSANIGGRSVTLNNVESVTYDQYGRVLEGAMLNRETPKADIPPYQKKFAEHAAGANLAQPKLALVPWFGPGAPSEELKQGATSKSQAALASKLPKLPAGEWYKVSQGKSNVQEEIEGLAGQPAMMPRTGTSSGTGTTTPQGVDKIWVTQAFTIPQEELLKAFTDAGISAGAETTALRVEMVRQEQLADGGWGNETKIKPLAIHHVPALPGTGSSSQANQYLTWAVSNSVTILTPSFHPQLAGDRWYAPGQEDPNKPVEVKPAMQSPAGQQQMYPGTSGPGAPRQRSSRSRSGRSSGSRAPEDAQRPSSAGPRRGMPSGMGPGGGMPPGAYEMMMMQQMGGGGMPGMSYGPSGSVPTNAIPQDTVVPQGPFAVSALTGDIFTWVHDDTVEPGKTYRYKMRYLLMNPLYGRTQAVQNPEDAKQFALSSDFTEWTEPVTVAPTIRFFIAAGVGPGASSVRFDVFHWQLGQWHLKTFIVAPGDMIGLPDKSVDYQTGYTLVDASAGTAGGTPHVVIADSEGQLAARTFRDDQAEELTFKRSIDWGDPNAPNPNKTVPGMPPGMGYPGGMPGMMGYPGGGTPPGMGPNSAGRRQPSR